MLIVGIPHRLTGDGRCGPRPLSSLLNYLAELSREDTIGWAREPDKPFSM